MLYNWHGFCFMWVRYELTGSMKVDTTMTASGPEKLLYFTLGIMFLVLGVVGLIIPILPGVLFLAGALYMLSRASRRVRAIADDNPTDRGSHAGDAR